MKNCINFYISQLLTTIKNQNISEIETCAKVLLEGYHSNKQIFVCGNGGSAATASHFACDINKGVSYGLSKRFKVLPLLENIATISAYTNDVNYDSIFVEQLKNFYNDGDILIGISGSGNSTNVLNAVSFVNENNGTTIGWTGYTGGKLKELTHYSINANIEDMQISEDLHMIYTHILMKTLRNYIVNASTN